MKMIILVTGGCRGIGRAVCELLTLKGFRVFGTTRKLKAEHKKLAYKVLELDVNVTDSIKRCIRAVIDMEGKLDILIDNAGYALCGSLTKIPIEAIIDQFQTNLFGPLRMIKEALPFMKSGSRIINVGSIGGRIPLPYHGAYSASKAALMNMSDTLGMELIRQGIFVSLIEPGDTRTEMHENKVIPRSVTDDPVAAGAIEAMNQAEKKGASPQKIARTILKAVTAKRPKQRYTAGLDARFVNWFNRLLPSAIRLWIIRKLYKIPDFRKD